MTSEKHDTVGAIEALYSRIVSSRLAALPIGANTLEARTVALDCGNIDANRITGIAGTPHGLRVFTGSSSVYYALPNLRLYTLRQIRKELETMAPPPIKAALGL